MALINPYYVRTSPVVGDVVDVATWSPREAVSTAIFTVLLACGFAALSVYLWDPKLFLDPEPEWISGLNEGIALGHKNYPREMLAGIGALGLLAYACFAGTYSSLYVFMNPSFYFRAGPGGFSVRVPNGISWAALGFGTNVLELDIPWKEIADWHIIEERPIGAISRSTYNYPKFVFLKTVGGKKHAISTGYFRESPKIIATKIRDAAEMTVPELEPQTPVPAEPNTPVTHDKHQAIADSLDELLQRTSEGAAVIFSDVDSEKFVQFAHNDGRLLFDLPSLALNDVETESAAGYFARIGEQLQEYDLLDGPGGVAVTRARSYQVDVADDVQYGAQLALDIFAHVYQLPPDFQLTVEEL